MVINQFLNAMILPLPGCVAGTWYLQGGPKPVMAGRGYLRKGLVDQSLYEWRIWMTGVKFSTLECPKLHVLGWNNSSYLFVRSFIVVSKYIQDLGGWPFLDFHSDRFGWRTPITTRHTCVYLHNSISHNPLLRAQLVAPENSLWFVGIAPRISALCQLCLPTMLLKHAKSPGRLP